MEPILKSDIFFFITSLFVVILTVVLVWLGYYLIKIFKDLSEISTTLKKGVEDVSTKIRNAKDNIMKNPLISFILSKFGKTKNTKKNK